MVIKLQAKLASGRGTFKEKRKESSAFGTEKERVVTGFLFTFFSND